VAAGGPPLPAHGVKEPTLLSEEMQPDGGAAGDRHVVRRRHLGDSRCGNRDWVLGQIERQAGIRLQYLSGK